jgi:hypothetical protein
MDIVLNLFSRLVGLIAPTLLFGGIGWLFIKIVTLGRYPKRSSNTDWSDADAFAILGAAICVAILCLVEWIHSGM